MADLPTYAAERIGRHFCSRDKMGEGFLFGAIRSIGSFSFSTRLMPCPGGSAYLTVTSTEWLNSLGRG